jgi:1-acyl-sn-glycerol-3-phosphate acyltransferase
LSSVLTAVRLLVGLVVLAILVAMFLPLLFLLLPSRRLRIRVGNAFGHVAGRSLLAICGARVDPAATAELEARKPAIFVSNHASIVDIFAGIWLAPYDTCGVAKKEVIWYPFFGLLYLVSGHLRLDRGNRSRAVGALRGIAEVMRRHRLGAWIWPEGTRARDGRLLPFKKGFAHLALATGLPIVPVVLEGAHHIWPRTRMRITPGRLGIRVLPSIPTTAWTPEGLDAQIAEVRQAFVDALPEDQRPQAGGLAS